MDKINLKGLTLSELEQFVTSLGEKTYRAQQIFKWIYGAGVSDIEKMTNLAKSFRQTLLTKAVIHSLQLITSRRSTKDATIKFLFQLQDGFRIESVLMLDSARTTLCISTQAGCAVNCTFCATGLSGLQRHLTAGEIVDQLFQVEKITGKKVSNLVCMGMGEPFHNYDNLIKACAILSHDLGPNLAKRHIVISTSGIVPKIKQYADEGHKYKLAISLNAPTDDVRSQLMPLNKKWPLKELIHAAKYYTQKSDQRVTFEYVLMHGINDSPDDAQRFRKLVSELKCKVNLIPYNATEGVYRRPSEKRILDFYKKMALLRAPVTIRWSKGDDIDAGCGQLAGGLNPDKPDQ